MPGIGRTTAASILSSAFDIPQPYCFNFPWNSYCFAYSLRQPTNFPVKSTKSSLPLQVIGVGVVFNSFGEVLIDQRLDEGFLGGLWEFPGGKKELDEDIKETISRELREELAIEVEVGDRLIGLEHSYSHKKLYFEVYLCKWISGKPQALASQQFQWVNPNQLDQYPFPMANAKMISALRKYLLRGSC